MRSSIINNFENSNQLCDNWGWYVDLEAPNDYLHDEKYRIRKLKPVYNLEITQQEANKNFNEYCYYMNQCKKYGINNSLAPILEEKEEEEDEKVKCSCHVLRVTSVTIITGLLTYIILFTI